jgi:hypothetical protein
MSLGSQIKGLYDAQVAGFIQNEDTLCRRSVLNNGASAIIAGAFVKYSDQYTTGNPKELDKVVLATATDTGLLFALQRSGYSSTFAQNDTFYVSNQVFTVGFATAGEAISYGDKLMIGTGGKLVVWDEDAANTIVGIANQDAANNQVFSFKRTQS